MKRIIGTGAVLCLLITISSCKKSINEFLDKAPGVDVTENTVFASRQNVEGFVSTMYQFGMVSIFPNRDAPITSTPISTGANTLIGTLSSATDEAENEATFVFGQSWNSGSILSTTIIGNEDNKYYARWKAIRIANILLERINEVPDADGAFKKQVTGEAQFIRALQNFETLKRYGGIPIVNIPFDTSAQAIVPRSNFEESVNAIVKDCNEAAANLPVVYSAAQRGRATRIAALALKSRTLLYAASPLFNTATPYLSMANADNNKLICYGTYDVNRWKLAAEAAKAVLDEAAAATVSLVDVPANRDPTAPNRATGNYWVAWERQDNSEVILADKSYAASSMFGFPWQHIIPVPMGGFYGGASVTHNFIMKYENKATGLPQTWNPAGGDDLVTKYDQLDPRFKQTIGYNGGRWNASHPIIETFVGGKHAATCYGGAWMMKHNAEALGTGASIVPSIALYRLNEFYLNYAEAMNEFQGPGSASSATPPENPVSPYDAVNKIRIRSGMPNLPAGLSKDAFRARVRNERAIELVFEDHRFWDIRRWMIAEDEGVMKGSIYGIRITKLAGTAFRYTPYVIDNRTFLKRMYLHPFLLNEVLKGNLVQNPGW